MDLAVEAHRIASGFPREELFALSAQLRRTAYSVPANIAEGYGREHTAEYTRFLRIAQGSLKELETHVLLSVRLGFTTDDSAQTTLELADRVGRMLRALIRSLEGTS